MKYKKIFSKDFFIEIKNDVYGAIAIAFVFILIIIFIAVVVSITEVANNFTERYSVNSGAEPIYLSHNTKGS